MLSEFFCSLKCSHLCLNDSLYPFLAKKDINSDIKDYIRKTATVKAITRTHRAIKAITPERRMIPVPLFYHENAYYTKFPVMLDQCFLDTGLKLISVNGFSTQELMIRYQNQLTCYDIQNRIFHSAFGNPETHSIGSNLYFFLKAPRYQFLFENAYGKKIAAEYSPEYSTVRVDRMQNSLDSLPKLVCYLPEWKILYLRIPFMNPEDLDYYRKNIALEGRKGRVCAVVFDIRCNPGGKSSVWMEILRQIISREMEYTTEYIAKDSSRTREFIDRFAGLLAKRKKKEETVLYDSFGSCMHRKKIPFLDNQEYLSFTSTTRLIPCPDSLSLSLPMYIIARNLYSAAGAFTAFAASHGIRTVGEHNVLPLGSGFEPMLLELPGSRLIFSASIALDVTNCKTLTDLLHAQVDIPVRLSLKGKIAYYNTDIGSPGKENLHHLLRDDPYFRTILSLVS